MDVVKRKTVELKKVPVRTKLALGAGAGLGGTVLAVFLGLLPVFETFEARTLDMRHQILARPTDAVSRIVIVLIDQPSVDYYAAEERGGTSWPWPREFHAAILRFLSHSGARSVIFDVIFSEPSRYAPEDDQELGRAAAAMKAAYFAVKLDPGGPPGEPRAGAALKDALTGNTVSVPGWAFPEREGLERAVLPVEEILYLGAEDKGDTTGPRPTVRLGFVNVVQDRDNTIRRVDLLLRLRDGLIPSLPLRAAIDLLAGGGAPELLGGNVLRVGGQSIPLLDDGRMLIRYYGPEQTFMMKPAADLVASWGNMDEGKDPVIDPAAFKDRIVIVGVHAAGAEDIVTSPTSTRFPGPELHATVLANIIGGDFLRMLGGTARIGMIIILAAGTGVVAMLVSSAALSALLALLGYVLYGAVVFLAFRGGFVLDLFHPALAVAATYTFATALKYIVEGRQKREVAGAFKQYMSQDVIREILRDPEKLRLGGERREITVYFSDIQGFSTFSEGMEPEELVEFLNIYLSAMTDRIMARDGVIDKYEGDAIMAFWGAPLPLENHARAACLAALDNVAALRELNLRFQAEGRPPLRSRIGIHSGPAVVGNMGSTRRFAYTAMGDTVNLASRLEGANKEFGTYVMMSEATYEQARDAVVARRLGRIRVVGKKVPVAVYELIGRTDDMETDPERSRAIEAFEGALRLAEGNDFQAALDGFSRAREALGGDPPSERYIEFCRSRLDREEAPWDGVLVLKSK